MPMWLRVIVRCGSYVLGFPAAAEFGERGREFHSADRRATVRNFSRSACWLTSTVKPMPVQYKVSCVLTPRAHKICAASSYILAFRAAAHLAVLLFQIYHKPPQIVHGPEGALMAEILGWIVGPLAAFDQEHFGSAPHASRIVWIPFVVYREGLRTSCWTGRRVLRFSVVFIRVHFKSGVFFIERLDFRCGWHRTSASGGSCE